MSIFNYQARDYKGELVKGRLDADSSEAVAAYLLQEGLTPTTVEEILPSRSFFERLEKQMFSRGVEARDVIVFCRQMYTLTKAGVPVVKALTYLIDSTSSPVMISSIRGVIKSISSGQTLTQSFAKYPNIFSPIFISIIDAGENSGQLEAAFLQISEHLELELKTSRQFKSVMRYPTLVIVVAIIAISVINFFVIPAFAKLFASFKADLPLPTRVLIATSNFFISYWIYILVFAIISFFIANRFIKTDNGRLAWDRYKLKLPIIGDIINQIILARFARMFAMMIRSGVPLSQSLTLVANIVGNEYMRQGILFIRNGVEHGESISKKATEAHFFTPMVLQMLSVGEETGSIDYLLVEIAQYYENEVDYSLKKLSEAIEPILLIFLGTVALTLALGVFLPMWDMVKFVR